VARPTISGYAAGDEYHNQGAVVQELRKLSQNHDIPVLTATQNSKASENLQSIMDNTTIG